ncbi:MAG: type II toxin-antitoxin system RelE/ParE family toxin [Terracidiphilus sp.]|jgi:plasmid stabilization system protein ParE
MAAADDLEGIADYLYLHHPSVATSTLQRLYNAAKSLKAFPYAGRIGTKGGTRELALAPLPYLMIYTVDDSSIHILRILHAAQERP